MPHKCTKCKEIFKDGDSSILNGCPNCGGKKFIFALSEVIKNKKDRKLSIKEDIDSKTSIKSKSDIAGKRVESVLILEPGSYEINISSILERDELVMAMKEEGSYEINLPSIFKRKSKKKKREI